MIKVFIFIFICCFSTSFSYAQTEVMKIENVIIDGYIGERIDDCINKRVIPQDVSHLIEPFRYKTETRAWQSEFWGKWILGAISSYRYTQDKILLDKIDIAVNGLLETQLKSGYIGNYSEEAQLQQWDIWGRKYTLLGLLAYYDLTGQKRVLESCCKLANHLIKQLSIERKNIILTGNFRGMASCSILEPIVLLYNRTADKRYLDFANYIAEQMETLKGPQLVSKAMQPVAKRFPSPESWWSWENGQKAYEMMSCYVGLLELYKITANHLYLKAVTETVTNIINTEINVAGSGSSFECWYSGTVKQTIPTYHTMETCVTFTWMQLCNFLLLETGNSIYADEVEKTAYNALMASLKSDASDIAKYSPLEGYRFAGEDQCGMHINCCNANGPRAFALLPQFAYYVKDRAICVNLYTTSTAEVKISDGCNVRFIQTTDYPLGGRINIEVIPEKEAIFPISLRIPSWSEESCLKINNVEISEPLKRGEYFTLNRNWKAGDKIELTLDMRARVIELNMSQAIVRGPVVFARDSRFNDGDIDESSILIQKDGYIELKPILEPCFSSWIKFAVPAALGPEVEEEDDPIWIKVCDFASAGNDWDKNNRYRVWLPKTLNVMRHPYVSY